MCHNSVLENEQIEKCIENGMPSKIIKTIKYTMRKRAANNEELNQKHLKIKAFPNKTFNNTDNMEQIKAQQTTTFISKCPFGHGKFSTPSTTFFSEHQTPTTTTAAPAATLMDDFDFSNSNNNLYERFPQNSQLSTKITNLSGHNDKNMLAKGKIYNDDILAKSTQLTREFAYKMQQAIRTLQSSKTYT